MIRAIFVTDRIRFQLEQMDLEIQSQDSSVKSSLTGRLNCYHAELKRLRQEFQIAKNETQVQLYDSSDFDELTTSGISGEQQRRLLDNSERIERTGNRLTEGYRTILETEQIGSTVLKDLAGQREVLQKSRSRVSSCMRKLCQSILIKCARLFSAARCERGSSTVIPDNEHYDHEIITRTRHPLRRWCCICCGDSVQRVLLAIARLELLK